MMRKNVVIIDDDTEDAEIVIDIIQSIDIRNSCTYYREASDAVDALTSTQTSPDLIIIDFFIPPLNGYDCLLKLRKLPHLKNTKMVVYSSTTLTTPQFNNVFAQGATFFVKPSSYDELTEVLNELLAGAPVVES